ncbi:PefC/AfrB family outer membrane usher protein, partial [Citrobacter portucalensis]|uniref:PefC/AfrB family outer membrane usher protein n=1 Tax=Citrobacter portucalensis TaxID=1639133 RepID=UPI00226B1DAF
EFLHGVTDVPAVFNDNIRYPAGEYYVDILVNSEPTGKMRLTVSKEDESSNTLCLSPEWLQSAGVFLAPAFYASTFDSVRNCYRLTQAENTAIVFDQNAQTLAFSIPQAWLLRADNPLRWDEGIAGLRMNYAGNVNQSFQKKNNSDTDGDSNAMSAYGTLRSTLNAAGWVLDSDMSASRYYGQNTFSTNSITLTRPVPSVRGDFTAGRAMTHNQVFSDFSFDGLSLQSNDNMRPWESRGYAPVITGVAASMTRITVSQNGYTLRSLVVPAGAWKIDDLAPAGTGTLLVTAEDSSGKKTVTEYPVATLPTLLRSGDYNYALVTGQKNTRNDISGTFRSGEGYFMMASLDRGFDTRTLNIATILHKRYQSAGVGISQSMGFMGALSLSTSTSRAEYDDNTVKKGNSVSVKYAKSFTNRTDLQLMTWRYQTEGYIDFASWDPDSRRALHLDGYDPSVTLLTMNGRERARYEARLTQQMDNASLGLSWWQTTYYGRQGSAQGGTLSGSTAFHNGVSLFLSGSYSRSPWSQKDDYYASLGISVPFTLEGRSHYSSSTASWSRASGSAFNTSAGATVSDALSYSVNTGMSAQQGGSAGATVSYAMNPVSTQASVEQSRDRTSLGGGFSGSVLLTGKTGLTLTRETADTIALVRVKDTPGVRVNGSRPTDSHGVTVMGLTPYMANTLSIDPESMPENREFTNANRSVTPTERAIVYREFDAAQVKRYILQVRDRQGRLLAGGNARTDNGLDAGFVTADGVLIMSLLAAPSRITINRNIGGDCSFSASSLSADINHVQAVQCDN